MLSSLLKSKPVKSTAKVGVSLFFKLYNKMKALEDPDCKDLAELKSKLRQSKTVLNGPFKGMKYLDYNNENGDAIYKKILGSYETELHQITETLAAKDYTEILDVGSAEGYYVVGMALKNKTAKIYAYDTEEKCRALCAELAKRNNVEDRITLRSTLTPEKLKDFKFTGKNLIISDCEGYEKVLFNTSNLSNLSQSDILIEVHDFNDIEISTYLKNLLSKTHNIESIYSLDDIQKAIKFNYPETNHLSLHSKRKILGEGRASIMEWLLCTPKNN